MSHPGLLVSVRDADEAAAASTGGASLIDVKEPARGPLGRADADVVAAVVAQAGRTPISAAMGELRDEAFDVPEGVRFAKWGLAGCRTEPRWQDRLDALRRRLAPIEVVAVGYADWQCAQAPPLDDVLDFACSRGGVFLVDTCCKEPTGSRPRPSLLDWLDLDWLTSAVARCRESKVRIALAGSLDLATIRRLAPLRPDWFAVRGAACEGDDRAAPVSATRVRELAAACRAG